MTIQLNDTLGVTREPPKPRSFSKAYWDATREKRLLVQYDKRSGRYQFFPRATSIYNGLDADEVDELEKLILQRRPLFESRSTG